MDLRTLKVFLTVADTMNFSRAGERMHMSVSAVSRSIGRLEDEVGIALMERDKRTVRLTAAGREFLNYARGALADWQQMRGKLGSGAELAGEVSLFCSVTASYSVLAPILEAFRQAHPAVEIMMHTGDQADGVGRVLEGRDDVAVCGCPAQLPPRLEFLPLLNSPLKFCAPRAQCAVNDMLHNGDVNSADFDWEAVPLIVPERGVTQEMLDDWFREQGIRPQIYAQVAGHEAIVAMVCLGLGIGIAPQLVIESSGLADNVRVLEVPAALPTLKIGLCSLRQRLASPLVRSLWDVAGQTYAVEV